MRLVLIFCRKFRQCPVKRLPRASASVGTLAVAVTIMLPFDLARTPFSPFVADPGVSMRTGVPCDSDAEAFGLHNPVDKAAGTFTAFCAGDVERLVLADAEFRVRNLVTETTLHFQTTCICQCGRYWHIGLKYAIQLRSTLMNSGSLLKYRQFFCSAWALSA